MSGYRVQCSGCGYLTYASEEPCPRCGTLLSLGHIVGDADSGATIYHSGDTGDVLGDDRTEALGSMAPELPSITPVDPTPFAFSVPPSTPDTELPDIRVAGTWDPPLRQAEEVIPLASDPREFMVDRTPLPESQALQDQPWKVEAPPAPPEPAPLPPPPPLPRPVPSHPAHFAPPVAKVAPPRRQLSTAFWIGVAAAGIAAIGLGVLAAAIWSSGGKPSMEATRKKYAPILAQQPDFVATLEGFENGVPVKLRYASLNGERLVEVPLPKSMFLDTSASGSTQVTVIFNRDDRVTAIAHEFWVYRTVPKSNPGGLASATDPFGEVGRVAGERTTTILEAGVEKVGEYDTTVLLISEPNGSPIQVNVAPALGNLIVRLDIPAGVVKSKVPLRYTLTNISTTVDPELFRIPTSYDLLKAP